MVADLVRARRRDQGREPLDQFQGLEEYVGGAVAPTVPEPVAEPAVGKLGEPPGCERGPGHVATQPL